MAKGLICQRVNRADGSIPSRCLNGEMAEWFMRFPHKEEEVGSIPTFTTRFQLGSSLTGRAHDFESW